MPELRVNIIADATKFTKDLEKTMRDLERFSDDIKVGKGFQNQINELKNSISEMSAMFKTIVPKNIDSGSLDKVNKKLEQQYDKIKYLQNVNNDLKIKIEALNADNVEKQLESIRETTLSLKDAAGDVGKVISAAASSASIDGLSKQYETLLSTIEKIEKGFEFDIDTSNLDKAEGKMKDMLETFEKEKDKLSKMDIGTNGYDSQLAKVAEIAKKISDLDTVIYDSLSEKDSSKYENIFSKTINNIVNESEELESKIRSRMSSIKEEIMNSLRDTQYVDSFEFKNGGINIPVKLDTSVVSSLEKQLKTILNTLEGRIQPIAIPVNFTSKYSTKIRDELKSFYSNLETMPEGDLKATMQKTLDNISGQFEKEVIKIKIDTNIKDILEQTEKGARSVQSALKQTELYMYPQLKIDDDVAGKLKEQVKDICSNMKIDLTGTNLDLDEMFKDEKIKELQDKLANIKLKITPSVTFTKKEITDFGKELSSYLKSNDVKVNIDFSDIEEKMKSAFNAETITQWGTYTANVIDTIAGEIKDLANEFEKIGVSNYNEMNLGQFTKSMEGMSNTIRKAFDIPTDSQIFDQWEKVQSKYKSLFADDKIDARTKEQKALIKELMEEYQRYIKMGGELSVSELSGNKTTQKKLESQYEKYINNLKEEAANKENAAAEQKAESLKQQEEELSKAKESSEELLKTLNNINSTMEDLNKNTTSIDPRVFDNLNSSLEKMEKTLENVSNMTHRAFDVSSDSEIAAQWDNVQAKYNSLFKDDKIDARTKEQKALISELISEYQKYVSMGGENPLSGVSGSKTTQKKLDTQYSKYISQQAEESAKSIANENEELEKVQRSAAEAALAKLGFTNANEKVDDSAKKSAESIGEEKKAMEDVAKESANESVKEQAENIKNAGKEAQESANLIVSSEKEKQAAYEETANASKQELSIIKSLSKEREKYSNSDDGFRSKQEKDYKTYYQGGGENPNYDFASYAKRIAEEENMAVQSISTKLLTLPAIDNYAEVMTASIKFYNEELKKTVEVMAVYDQKSNSFIGETTKISENFKQAADAAKKYDNELESAQDKVKKYLAQFSSKTLGAMDDNPLFEKLSGMEINSMDDIEKAQHIMDKLDAQYNKIMADARKGSSGLNPFVNMITNLDKADYAFKKIELDMSQVKNAPEELTDKFEALSKALNNLKNADGIEEKARAFGEYRVALNAVTNELSLYNKQQAIIDKEASKINAVEKALTNIKVNKIDPFQDSEGKTEVYKEKVKELNSVFEALSVSMREAANSDDPLYNNKEIAEYKRQLNELVKLLNSDAFNIENKKGNNKGRFISSEDLSNMENGSEKLKELVSEAEQYANSLGLIKKTGEKIDFDKNSVTQIFEDAEGKVYKLKSSLDDLNKGFRVSMEQNTGKAGLVGAFQGVFDGVSKYMALYFGLDDIIRGVFDQFRQGVDVLKDFDHSLTTISYTMNLSKSELQGLGESAVNMANDLNTSIEDAMSMYEIYANMQTSPTEIAQTAKSTAILSNLSGVDASTASDQIQGILNQFNMLEDESVSAADASMHVVDVLDKISANVAINYADGIKIISDAVQASGQAAHDAGMSYEQLAAISAKVAERTREDGSSIGNAFKTILTRITKVSTMPQYGDEVDNETVSKAAEALHSIGVEVYNADGSFRDLDIILGELAGKWDGLTDAQQAYISYQVAAQV